MNRNDYKFVTVKLRHNTTDIAVFNRNHSVSKATVAHDSKSMGPQISGYEQACIRLQEINSSLEDKVCMDMSGVDALIAYSDSLDHDDVSVQLCSELRDRFGGRLLMTNTVYTVEYSETAEIKNCSYEGCKSSMKFVNIYSLVKDYCAIHGHDPLKVSLIAVHIDEGVTVAVYDYGRITFVLAGNKCKSDTISNLLTLALNRSKSSPECILLTGRGDMFNRIKYDIRKDIRNREIFAPVFIVNDETHFERMADEALMFFAKEEGRRVC